MVTITLEKANLKKRNFIDEKELFLYIIDYIQDIQDISDVRDEIKNDDWYRISLDNYLKNV